MTALEKNDVSTKIDADKFYSSRSLKTVDIAVIGGGSAGIGAARSAAKRGAEIILIENDRIGGDCTFTGCIPSKAILDGAKSGLNFEESYEKARTAIQKVSKAEDEVALNKEGIKVAFGNAAVKGPHEISIDEIKLKAKRIIIATGANPLIPNIPGIDKIDYLTSDNIFNLERQPKSLIIVGGGPIGVEMAEAFARFKTQVTLIEGTDRLIPKEEPDASEIIEFHMSALGVTVLKGAKVVKFSRDESNQTMVYLEDGRSFTAERVLMALGRRPSIAGLGLQESGVDLNEFGQIKVDSKLQTTVKSIYAAGDVCQSLQFTHVAYRTGYIAATNAMAKVPYVRFSSKNIPWVTFTNPEVARVGNTESQVPSSARVAYLELTEIDRAIAADDFDGFIKVITVPRSISRHVAGGTIVGATIVAPRAGEMIHELVLAMKAKIYPYKIALTTHAYPTYSSGVGQAMLQFFGEFGGKSWRGVKK